MTRRLAHSHTLGGGLVLGLLVAQRPLWIFAAGVAVGAGLVFAVRALRRLVAGVKLGARVLERVAGSAGRDPAGAPSGREEGETRELPPAALTELEREHEHRIGLRQGEAAGIRAAARIARREQARRDAMQAALEDHWQDERRRSVQRAVTP